MNPINAIPSFNINLLLSYLEVHVEDKFASACMLGHTRTPRCELIVRLRVKLLET